jgi:hypothetical protein
MLTKRQRKEAEQAAVESQLAARASANLDEAKARVVELERALRPAWLTGRRLSDLERAEVEAELDYRRAVLAQTEERAGSVT